MRESMQSVSDLVLQHAPAGVAVLEGDEFRLRYANPAFLSMLQLGPDRLGQRIDQLLPNLPTALIDTLRSVQHTGESTSYGELDAATVLGAGAAEPVFWDVDCLSLDGGNTAVALMLHDISGPVRTRLALAESEERFRMAQELAVVGFVILRAIRDAAGRIIDFDFVYANPVALRADRMQPADVGQRTLRDVFPAPINRSLFDTVAQVVETGEPADFEIQLQTENGERWYRELVIKVGDGVAASFVDITERKHTQQALEAANMGAWEQNLTRNEVHHTPSLMTLYGLPPSEGPTPIDTLTLLIPAEDLVRLEQDYRQAIQQGTELRTEFRLQRPDGTQRWMQTCGRALYDEHGQAYKIVAVTLDITGQHQERERLEHFARTVAHDLKAPLRAMASFSELLQRSAGDGLQPQAQRHLEQILAGARKMSELVDGLLQYAQATPNAKVREPVALDKALEEALERLEPAIQETHASIEHTPLPVVTGNPVLLTQVLQNLIGNALKFKSARPPSIQISAERQGGYWLIAVRDNGIGVPEGWQERLFEPFLRAHREQDYPGLGLGLALVKDAIEHHGGRIWMESTPGGGVTVRFSLPAGIEEPDQTP